MLCTYDISGICRYALYGPNSRYDKAFGAALDDDLWNNNTKIQPRFPKPNDVAALDIAPSTIRPTVIAEDGQRDIRMARWGLIPFCAKDASRFKATFNARVETVKELPSYRTPIRRQRCVVPFDAFYEWRPVRSAPKQRFRISLKSGEPMGVAGIWDVWKSPEGPITTFSILVADANEATPTFMIECRSLLRPALWRLARSETNESRFRPGAV